MATWTTKEITDKIEALEDKFSDGIQSSELDTGQTKSKYVISPTLLTKSLSLWKGRLQQHYPLEYAKRYGPNIVSGYTRRNE